MKRFLKILAVAAIAVAAAVACVFAGCNNEGGEAKSDYNFTIVYEGGDKAGKPVNGQTDGNLEGGKLWTQVCLPGQGAVCIPLQNFDIYPDANGKLYLSQSKINELFSDLNTSGGDVTHFIFHVMRTTGYARDCEIEVNGKGDYEVKVVVGE